MIFTLLLFFSLYSTPVSALSEDEVIPYIKACSTIRDYNGTDDEIHKLTMSVLNNHLSFRDFSHLNPSTTTAGSLMLCNAYYINDIMYTAFRITTPRPTPEHLIDFGYYYNNGFFFFKNNPSDYSVTVDEVVSIIEIDSNTVCVIFTNTLTFNDKSCKQENSTITLSRDNLGWYVDKIQMGLDFSKLNEQLKSPAPFVDYMDHLQNALPMLVFFVTLIAVIIILYKFVLF